MPHIYKGKRYNYRRKRKTYSDGSTRKKSVPCWIPVAKRVDPYAEEARKVREAARETWRIRDAEKREVESRNARAVGKRYGHEGELGNSLRAVGL